MIIDDELFVKDALGERATDDFMVWLNEIGYYKCPAAKSHHGNYEGGLYKHSVMVANELKNLTDKLGLKWCRSESPFVVGLLHDICKTDDYKYDFAVSNEIIWNPSMNGHGTKSVYMLKDHFELTEEEELCITYHMGAFTDKSEWSNYSNAVKKNPNVLYTHTADMIASQIHEI